MDSVVRVKKSLRTPIKKLTSCVSGLKERRLCAKPRYKRGRGGGGRGGCNRFVRTRPLRSAHLKEPSIIRPYQAELEKERQVDTVLLSRCTQNEKVKMKIAPFTETLQN